MRLGQGYIPAVVDDSLIAGKSTGLGKAGSAARNERTSLIVAESRKHVICVRKVVIQPDIELGFIQFADRFVHEVEGLASDIRKWVEINHLRCYGINQIRGNLVAGSSARLTSVGIGRYRGSTRITLKPSIRYVRIIQRGDTGEITGPLRDSGNKTREGNALALKFLLAIDKEEGLAFADRAPDGAAKLVQIEFLRRGREEASGVQGCVAQKFEQRTVEIVAPGLGGHQYRRSRAQTVFRGVVVSKNLKFLNGIDGRQNRDAAGCQLVVVVAVQQPIGAIGAGTSDGK